MPQSHTADQPKTPKSLKPYTYYYAYNMCCVSPAKHGRHIGIMTPPASSSVVASSALSHVWFPINNC